MGLDEIIGKIESDSETKARQVVDKGKAEAERILAEARQNAKERIERSASKAANESKMILARETSKANVEASQMYQERLNDEVGRSIEGLRSSLGSYTSTDQYKKLLQKLAAKASDELGEGCEIYVQKVDVPKIKASGFTVSEAREGFSGGLKATSKDGNKYIDYTLETLLSGLRDNIAVEVLKLVK